jgi:putative oxidoreductase
MPHTRLPVLLSFGRVLLASLFVLGGINKLLDPGATLSIMRGAAMPLPELLLPLTIALELGGGLLVAFGRRFAWQAALLLVPYTLAANLFFHRFWEMAPPLAAVQLSLFFKNIAIVGGLLFVAGTAQSAD